MRWTRWPKLRQPFPGRETQRLLTQTGLVIDQLDATMDTAHVTVADRPLFAGLESGWASSTTTCFHSGTSDALSRLVSEGGLDADKIAAFWRRPPR
ncbi:MAG: hypothetical protein ACLTDR_06295 [Adlercreutzia equolifaciens]